MRLKDKRLWYITYMMPNFFWLIPKTPLKQLNWLLLITNYAKCGNIQLSICGNLRYPKTLSAEGFHLFPCLIFSFKGNFISSKICILCICSLTSKWVSSGMLHSMPSRLNCLVMKTNLQKMFFIFNIVFRKYIYMNKQLNTSEFCYRQRKNQDFVLFYSLWY